MKAYLLRRINPNDDGTRFCITAAADSIAQLFWLVDEFDDPGNYEYRGCTEGIAVCLPYKVEDDEVCDPLKTSLIEECLSAEANAMLVDRRSGWKRFESAFDYIKKA